MYRDKDYFIATLSDLTDIEKSNLVEALKEIDIVDAKDSYDDGYREAISGMRDALDGL